MSSEKYVFNQQTLQFEKLQVSKKQWFLRTLGIGSGVLVTSALLIFVVYSYFPSPKEKVLQNEIENMKVHYSSVNDQLLKFDKLLSNIQERDASVHRVLLGMEPIDEGIWNGGTGGHDEYKSLRENKNAGYLLVETQQKMDKLNRQLNLQSKSLESLISKAEKNEDKIAAIPSIKPVIEDKLRRNVKLL